MSCLGWCNIHKTGKMFKLGSYLSLMCTPKIWVVLTEQINNNYDLLTWTDGSRESGIDVSFGRKKEEICLVQNYWEENSERISSCTLCKLQCFTDYHSADT